MSITTRRTALAAALVLAALLCAAAKPMGFTELNAGDNEFVLLVGRKLTDAQVGVVGALNDPALAGRLDAWREAQSQKVGETPVDPA